MTEMHPDDERFAAFLRAAVPRLDDPALPIPREEMWTRIMAQRHGHALLTVATGDEESTTESQTTEMPLPAMAAMPRVRTRRTISVWGQGIPVRWAVPLVAGVLVVGVGLGLKVGERHPAHPQVAASPKLPKDLSPQVITEQHFRNVEHLLTTLASYKANGTETAQADASIAAQARVLLSTTQLLLDSPVALDPQRRHLLTDIDLALKELTQLAPDGPPAVAPDSVEHSIQSQVMQQLQEQHPAPAPAPKETRGL